MTKPIDLSCLSATELLRVHARVSAELRRRKICRSGNNPVADYAEGLVAKALDLRLASGSTAGYDATDAEGRHYEIKARRVTRPGSTTMLSAIRGMDKRHFDFLVAVIFDEDYAVRRAVQIPYDSVLRIAKFREHVNAHVVMIRSMWDVEGAQDITGRIADAV